MKVKGFDSILKKCAKIITIPIKVGNETLQTLFYIIIRKFSFKFIFEIPWIDDMDRVASTLHRCIKFCFKRNIYKIEANEQVAKQCNYVLSKRFIPYDVEDEAILIKND